jgi:hypothetical protein
VIDAKGRIRGRRVPKPKLPWSYPRRSSTPRVYSECGGKRIYHDQYSNPEGLQAAINKACGPKKAAREFDAGGPEAGTLVGARRAPGLFDENWGTPFPLTRADQRNLQDGLPPNYFLEPPTEAAPTNYIADRFEVLRQKFAPTKYTTAQKVNPLCGKSWAAITCEGPDGGIGWYTEGEPISEADAKRFTDAYCQPNKCAHPGDATPPPGVKEVVIKGKPRNPGPAGRFHCEPEAHVTLISPKLEQLPELPPGPAAGVPPSGCAVPDIILGRDDGPFASGWWRVDRCGTITLVPNPHV